MADTNQPQSDAAGNPAPRGPMRPKRSLCPYCGHTQLGDRRCERCGGLFEPLSRKATQVAMGPWFVRDKRNPFRPGCSFEVLRRQIEAGRVKPRSVIRGPTTHQFWMAARAVPGVAHLLGYCHACRTRVGPADRLCPGCGAAFRELTDRDALGLEFPTHEAAAAAQREIEREAAAEASAAPASEAAPGVAPVQARPTPDARPTPPRPIPVEANAGDAPGAAADLSGLLDEVLGAAERRGPAAVSLALPRPELPAEPEPWAGMADAAAGLAGGAPPASAGGEVRGSNAAIWILAAAIALATAALVFLFLRNLDASIPEGSTPAGAVEMPATPGPRDRGPPSEASTPSPGRAAPAETPLGDAAGAGTAENAVTGPAAGAADTPTPPPAAGLADPLAEARRLENSGKLEEALALLQAAAETTPLSERTPELDVALRRVEGLIRRRAQPPAFKIEEP